MLRVGAAGWPLVGRGEELDLLAGVAGERSGSVVVAGAIGVGKSRLVADFLDRVAAEGVRTVLVRATRSTATIPFGSFASWAPERSRRAASDRVQVLRAIGRGLLDGDERVVIAVDDAHLLDDGSAALVLHLVMHTPARMVVTVRSGEPCPDAVVALWKEGLAERVDLEPLSEPEAVELLERILGGPVDPAAQRRLWALTKGTPLYLREVVRAGIDQKVLAPEAGVWRWRGKLAGSDRLGQLMGDHLSRTNAEERRVLDLLAFGEPLPVELVAELGSADVLAEAEQHGFVVVEDTPAHPTVRLAHPLYGEVLRAGVPTLAARQYQCALAAAAMAVGWQHRDPMRVASWWLDSGSLQGDPEVFLAAAHRALALTDWHLADRLGQAAEAADAGAQATLARAAALAPLGQLDEADQLLADLSTGELDGETAAEAALARARPLFWSRGQPAAALEVLSHAAERLPAPIRAHVLAHWGYLAVFACDPTEAIRLATEAMAESGPVTEFRVEAMAAASLAWMIQGRTAAAITAAEAAIPYLPAVPDIDPNPVAVMPAAYALARVFDGRLDEAAAIAETTLEVAQHDEVRIFKALAATLVGRVALFQGHLVMGRQCGQEALSMLREAQLPAHWPASVVATAAAQLGDTTAAEQALKWAASADPAVPLYCLELNLAQAWLAAARGELSGARAIARDVAADAANAGAWAFELVALLDLARLGAPNAATGRLTELTQVVEGAYAAAVGAYVGALAAGASDGLDDASVRFEEIGAILLAAEAAAGAAAAHRAVGRRGSHLISLARARTLADRCDGARTPALRDIDAEPTLGTLTDREREVVELAARGLTNREIGARLYVSVRTVNTHLYRAYAKLGLSDRTQLAPLLFVAADRQQSKTR